MKPHAASVKRAARATEAYPLFRVLARSGFAANGVVHLIVGIIILTIAAGADGESDQTGALKAIASAPLGFLALWILAIALCGLAAWHLLEGILSHAEKHGAKGEAGKWGRRAGEWGQAVVFILLGTLAASVALGARPDSEDAAEGASRGVLSIPGGSFALAAVGLGIGICGVVFVVMGVRRSFQKKMDIPPNVVGRIVTVLGVAGFIAKGIALVLVGVLLLIAVVRLDAAAAGGLDGAVDVLLTLAYGPWLVGIVGVGFLAYGVFCLFRAPYARL